MKILVLDRSELSRLLSKMHYYLILIEDFKLEVSKKYKTYINERNLIRVFLTFNLVIIEFYIQLKKSLPIIFSLIINFFVEFFFLITKPKFSTDSKYFSF